MSEKRGKMSLSQKQRLNDYDLTDKSCSALATVLVSDTSLKELNMSNNNLQDSEVKLLCTGLKNINCKLEILRLSDCSITEEGYKALSSALRSNPSHLIELDLTGNDPGQSGVKALGDLLQDPNCQLKTLSLNNNCITEGGCHVLATALNSNPSNLTELDLSENKLGNPGMKIILTLFENVQCRLEKLKLNCISITDEGCAALASAFNSNLRELDLSRNQIRDSGVTEISSLLRNSQTLQILRLSDCSITEEGYKALASALRSNPSHLIELDLTGNDPGQSGVKELTDLLQDPNCQLKTLRFLGPAADEACQYVTGIVGKNPLLLRELNLSLHDLEDTGADQIAALLQDKHCQLNTLLLRYCQMTDEGCSAVTSALKSNPSHLRELELSWNELGDSGVKNLSDLLMNPQCKLEKLDLFYCRITEKQCLILTSALKSNPSHLRELELSRNELGDSGVKNLSDLLTNPQFKLKKLVLFACSITEEQCLILTSALKSNPSHLRELNLSGNQIKNTGVNHLCDVLKDSHCKLERLSLYDCGITDVSSLTQSLTNTEALQFLKELDLRNNMIGDSKQQLSDVLRDSSCKLIFLSLAADEACQYVTGITGKNPLLLGELKVSGRELGNTGVNHISALLQDKDCQLNTLILCGCVMTEKQSLILTSALKSNSSHLIELDLSGNKMKNIGVNVCDLLKDSHCKLERLSLFYCSITEKQCLILTSALKSNPSHLRELDLSGNKIKNTGVNHLCDVLKDSHCKLERLRLSSCEMTDESFSAVTSALKSNPSHLRELNLSGNKLGDSGVKNLSDLLMNPQFKLEKLVLFGCSITEKQCLILTSVLKSNPSHLRELDLSGNKLGDSGVKNLSDLLMNPQFKLEKLVLWRCSITEKQCLILTSALKSNPSHLRELDLSVNQIKNTGVNHLCDVLKDSHCNLERLSLHDCGITDVSSLTQSLTNTKGLQFLKELDLSGNMIGDSKQKLTDVLRDSDCELRV
ncbi:protein NLRC5-like isoform X2 [Onychostoma macrolepis]|uniref:protein NLRC5-like isoform X2 n=1 Tax=Onychostoma macrolepis TaxID=369639 RepID=UPI00272DBE42|nr:protein NLRC5-like isoform X2 [Onychostoma macrolepis]